MTENLEELKNQKSKTPKMSLERKKRRETDESMIMRQNLGFSW